MKIKIIFCCLTLFVARGIMMGQTAADSLSPEKKDAISSYLENLEKSGSESILPPKLKPQYLEDSTVQTRYYQTLTEYFEYRISGYQHREKVFSWQLGSSKLIFFAVLFLLLVGIYFSYLQFRQAIKLKQGDGMDTTVKASSKGVEISSPVLGVIILAISLVFFYLYLVYVYPIQEIF